MSWDKSSYTDAGTALLSESLSGGALTITRAVSGTGTIDSADLPKATAISGDTHDLTLLGIDTVTDGGETARRIRIQITGAEKSYIMHQIGVYGQLSTNSTDSLLFIMQDDRGVEVPSGAENEDFEIEFSAVLAISNKANISIKVSPQIEALAKLVQEEIDKHNADPNAHNGQIGGKGSAIIKDITIPADGWDWQRESGDEETLGMDDFRCVVDVAVDDATEDMFPSVALHKAALEVAKRAGLCPTVQALAGVLRFWARNAPEADMAATVALVSPGGASGGGSSSYVLPVATATRLGGVKIGSGVSVSADGTISASTSGITQDEVVSAADTDKMLDEIFPAES